MTKETKSDDAQANSSKIDRRDFLGKTAAVTGTALAAALVSDSLMASKLPASANIVSPTRLTFSGPDSMFHGHD